jgi:hypothetical protein
LHRVDGPAVERPDGSRIWYRNGELHRIGGPSIEKSDGTRVWYLDGQRHRTDGPAVKRLDGTRQWYLVGFELVAEEHAMFRKMSRAEQEAVLVFLTDGMPPQRAIGAARLVLT